MRGSVVTHTCDQLRRGSCVLQAAPTGRQAARALGGTWPWLGSAWPACLPAAGGPFVAVADSQGENASSSAAEGPFKVSGKGAAGGCCAAHSHNQPCRRFRVPFAARFCATQQPAPGAGLRAPPPVVEEGGRQWAAQVVGWPSGGARWEERATYARRTAVTPRALRLLCCSRQQTEAGGTAPFPLPFPLPPSLHLVVQYPHTPNSAILVRVGLEEAVHVLHVDLRQGGGRSSGSRR